MSYWYLATPYSRYPHGIEAAYKLACSVTADLIRNGVPVFSPIAHSHGVAVHGGIDPFDHYVWLPADRPMMRAALGLLVVRADGWHESVGIAHEIAWFNDAGKPVRYMDVGTIPSALLMPQMPDEFLA